jgi:hypothetical protein
VAQSSEQALFTSEFVHGFDSRYGLMWSESVNALPKVVCFLPFPPTGKVDRVGCGINTVTKVISQLL